MEIIINEKKYELISGYKHDNILRAGQNALTREVFGFDFEKWYQAGLWGDNTTQYSLRDGDRIVSNVMANVIEFLVHGKAQTFVQLGTVMTAKDCRNQGLSAVLLQHIVAQWEDKCDMLYLFANDKVLDFYPKFGFVAVDEFYAAKPICPSKSVHIAHKMDMSSPADLDLLRKTAQNAVPNHALSMVGNESLIMFDFACCDIYPLKETLFFIPTLGAIAMAEVKGDTLILYDILAAQQVDIDDVIAALASHDTTKVVLRFAPQNNDGYELKRLREPDTTLFVLKKHASLFQENKLIFPVLSYT